MFGTMVSFPASPYPKLSLGRSRYLGKSRASTSSPRTNYTYDLFVYNSLVDNPLTLSLSDLQDRTRFRTITIPVTLVCAGNRRKEQNEVHKSLGFSWGAAGVSTALWTGVYLADVLAAACPSAQEDQEKGE